MKSFLTLAALFLLALTFTVAVRTEVRFGTPTVIEVRVSAQRAHIFIFQSDGSVLWWRRTP